MDDMINGLLEKLRSLHDYHVEIGGRVFDERNLADPMCWLTVATMNRSVNLLSGFCSLIEQRNIIAAAPLLRVQLDNALRYSAAWLVDDPKQFALSIRDGNKVQDLKDRHGHQMRDTYLKKMLAEDYPWVSTIYEDASGYVHLSEEHFRKAMTFSKLENGRDSFTMSIGREDSFVSDEEYIQMGNAFGHATGLFLGFVEWWLREKNKEY